MFPFLACHFRLVFLFLPCHRFLVFALLALEFLCFPHQFFLLFARLAQIDDLGHGAVFSYSPGDSMVSGRTTAWK